MTSLRLMQSLLAVFGPALLIVPSARAVQTEPAAAQEAPSSGSADVQPTAQSSEAQRLEVLEKTLAEQRKQLEALQAERAEATAAATDTSPDAEQSKMRIYGFMDVGGQWLHMAPGPYHDLIASKPAFVLGNVNLYFDARPSPAWRALVETRLTLAPNGTYDGLTQVDTRFMDTSSPSGRGYAVWSGVILERAWMQWTYSEHLALQAGYLLTPYGIWNVDHGTPTLISLLLPSLQVDEAIPQHQIGMQALGTFARDAWELGYHAYITNGRSGNAVDTDWRKGFGGRVILRHIGEVRLTLGGSGYYGSMHKEVEMLRIRPDATTGVPTANFEKSDLAKDGGFAADEWAMGGDLSLDWAGLRFRGEAMVRHVMYADGKHEHKTFGDPSSMMPSHYRHYAYGILAYRMARFFEPYLFVDYNDADPQVGISGMGICFSGGLNLYYSANAMLKLQYADQRFWHQIGGQMDMKFAAARVVLVF